jgi:hypothetical protein
MLYLIELKYHGREVLVEVRKLLPMARHFMTPGRKASSLPHMVNAYLLSAKNIIC